MDFIQSSDAQSARPEGIRGSERKAGKQETSDAFAHLTWSHLTVTVTSNAGHEQTLLRNLSGYAEPGQMLAVMGPSGSGKSTFIDAIAGRLAKNAAQTGSILVNGRKQKLTHGFSAYVTQDVNLLGTLTVKETIQYSANLRLPENLSRGKKQAIIEDTILEAGLEDCENKYIGNWHMRGVSGGEKRRVCIALGILMRPRLLFLDEPTSGLDSAAAFFIMETLKNLALDGRTVITSVHQPSSDVFDLFDQLYLLSGGSTVYFGEAYLALQFFAGAGFPCPMTGNPADHFLRCINTDFDEMKKSIISGTCRLKEVMEEGAEKDPLLKMNSAEAVQVLTEAYESSEYASMAAAKLQEIHQHVASVLEEMGSQTGIWTQIKILTKRSFLNMSRDFGYYWFRILFHSLLSLSVGMIYYDVGKSYGAILARSSCAVFLTAFMSFMFIGGFPSFVEEMKVYQKERLDGHYGVLAFLVSNFASSFPYMTMIAGVTVGISFPMMKVGGCGKFFFAFLLVLGGISAVESMMMVVASVLPNFIMGITVGSAILGLQIMTCGFFRLITDLPKPFWRYPLSYVGVISWSLQAYYKNDFEGLEFEPPVAGMDKIPGEYAMEKFFKISASTSKWWDLAIVWLNVLGYRIIFLLLHKVTEISPQIREIYNRKFVKKGLPREPSFQTISEQSTGRGSTPCL